MSFFVSWDNTTIPNNKITSKGVVAETLDNLWICATVSQIHNTTNFYRGTGPFNFLGILRLSRKVCCVIIGS